MGRRRELAAAQVFLGALEGRCAVLVIEGEPGIGKTTIWREAIQLAQDGGLRVLNAAPSESESALAFAALGDLLSPLDDDAFVSLPEPQRLAIEVALLRSQPATAPADPRAVGTALLSVLRGIAPVLLAIDDIQWLDPASAAALAFAVRRLDGELGVGLLGAQRIDSSRVVDPLGLARISIDVERVRLGPLDVAALHELVADRLGVTFLRPTLERLADECRGNPFYALELAQALARAGKQPLPGEPLPVPSNLGELVDARLARLSPAVRTSLLSVALCAEATASVIDPPALQSALEAGVLERHGERLRFAHPLYGAAVAGSATEAQRRAAHARLAEIAERPDERAHHLALATPGPDEGIALALEESAVIARSRGAWVSAAGLLEHARDKTPPEHTRDVHRRAAAAAEHHLHAGDRERGRELVDLVLAEDPEHSQALLVRAEVSYHEESFPEAQRLYLRLLDQDIEPRLRVIAEIGLAYVLSNLMQWQSAAALCRRALARAEEIGAPGLAAQAMAHCAMMDFLSGRGVDEPMVERSLRLEDVDPLVSVTRSPRTIAAFLDLFAGRHAAAREALAALCADARARGDESDLAFVLLWSSWLETRSGAFATAATVADEAVSLAALTGSRQVHAWARTQRALVHAHAGEDEEARRLCDEARDPVRESGNLLPVLWLAGTTALVELSVGDPAAAWRACEPLAQALERDGIGEPVPSFWLPDGLEALIALGQTARADALVTQLEAAAQRLDRAWALATAGRCRGLLLLGEGDAAAALPVLEGALAIHDRIDLPFDRARTLLTRGVVERRVGRRKAARESMMQARHAFSGMGARLWERRAQEELGRIPIRRGAAAGELTPAERRIAELVARGRSNREVADALFLSPKTVEAGLTRIYRKLGLRSRAALAAEWSDS